MKSIVITSACRTAIGAFMGSLCNHKATELGAIVAREALQRSHLKPEQLQEVIFGNVLQAGVGQNPARQAQLGAGIPTSVSAFTVNKVCGSGLKAVMLAAQAIRAGDIDIALAGGMETMSQAPFLVKGARAGLRLGHGQLIDSMVADGLWDVYNDFHMGITAEKVCEKYGVTREQQDEYAANSQRKAAVAAATGKFKQEIVPVPIQQRKGDPVPFDADEGIKSDTSADKLAKLKPAFKPGGTVTAGNASTINDGASALVVMSEDKAKELKLKPLARITGYASGATDPEWVMMAPICAVRALEQKNGISVRDYDLLELNEAFSAQSVALLRELELDPNRVNVHGGAVALGHPIGASGARVLTTLIYALQDRGLKKGVASLCLGGGGAVALSIEQP